MNHYSNDSDFYSDRKFCDHCNKYVSYLMSVESSFCVDCGAKVHLFSKKDWRSFNASLQERRPKGGRPRREKGKESA